MANHVLVKYLQKKEQLRSYFKNMSSKISLTADVWTSPNFLTILGVTGIG